MVDFTGPKVPIEWLNFTAAQSAKVSNSGTQDDSPVWGTENQIGNEFFGKMVDFVSFLFKSGSCSLWKLCSSLRGRFPSLPVTRGLGDLCQNCKSSKRNEEDLVGVMSGNQKSKVHDMKLDVYE